MRVLHLIAVHDPLFLIGSILLNNSHTIQTASQWAPAESYFRVMGFPTPRHTQCSFTPRHGVYVVRLKHFLLWYVSSRNEALFTRKNQTEKRRLSGGFVYRSKIIDDWALPGISSFNKIQWKYRNRVMGYERHFPLFPHSHNTLYLVPCSSNPRSPPRGSIAQGWRERVLDCMKWWFEDVAGFRCD